MSNVVSAPTYPVGVRALLPDQARRRRTVETSIVTALEARRFEEIVLPIIDFVDVYDDTSDRQAQRRSYRFVDREGELVAVRSDFTPMVARALAPSLVRAQLPMKVFYRGDVIRCEASRLGATREFFQIGAELIGDPSPGADSAMIELATGIVSALGIRPTVVVTDSSLATRLIESSTTSPEEQRTLRSALANKRAGELDSLRGIEGGRLAFLRRVVTGNATLDDFLALPETASAATNLAAMQRRGGSDATIVLAIDDVDEEPGYYTGVRFRIFEPKSRLRLAQGGRYDTLYSRFGADVSAVGFTLTVDYLDGEAR